MTGDNCLVLRGVVAKPPTTHQTPAGLSITRFSVVHESRQTQAGVTRPVRMRMIVMAMGNLSTAAQALQPGQSVQLSGFIETKRDRQGSSHIVLNATCIEQIIED